MKKSLLAIFAVIVLFAQGVFAAERGYISVSASDSREISPDTAQISIEVQTEDKSLQKATDSNKLVVNKIYDELNATINKTRGDYIKTSSYRANPVYSYANNKKTFEKYSVTNSILVNVKDISLVSKLVDMATSSGATKINGLNFYVADYDKECNELIAISTKKAQQKANAVATSVGSKISGIKSISASCSTGNSPRMYGMNFAKTLDSAEAASTEIESGKVKIETDIDADFFIGN